MIRVSATEAVVVVVVAKRMIRTPVAETTQDNQLKAKSMLRIPAAETIPVSILEQGFGTAAIIFEEQRPDCDGRGRGQCARGARGEGERAEYDAVQQHPVCRSKSGHGSPPG